jgi:hypothetical protein
MNSKLKNLIILIVLLVIVGFVYKMFFKKDTPGAITSSSSSSSATVNTNSTYGAEFLQQLLSLKVITLDDAILSSDPFNRLFDFTRVLTPDKNPGRPNPFAPIGTEGAVVLATPAPSAAPAPTPATTNNTPAPEPVVITIAATSVQSISASLNGMLPQSASGTSRWFEYGTAPQNLTIATAPTSQNTSGVFASQISGLRSVTTYYYRAVARVGSKTVRGEVMSFKTR